MEKYMCRLFGLYAYKLVNVYFSFSKQREVLRISLERIRMDGVLHGLMVLNGVYIKR